MTDAKYTKADVLAVRPVDLIEAWSDANHIRFAHRTHGQYTTDTVSMDALRDLVMRGVQRSRAADSSAVLVPAEVLAKAREALEWFRANAQRLALSYEEARADDALRLLVQTQHQEKETI